MTPKEEAFELVSQLGKNGAMWDIFTKYSWAKTKKEEKRLYKVFEEIKSL